MTVLDMQPERFWTLERCNNFRDLGGVRTGTGAALRDRRLFRSDSLAAASAGDRERLRHLGLVTVLDLRAEHEVALGGRYQDDRVTVHALPFGDLLEPATDWGAWNDSGYVAGRYLDLCSSARDSIMESIAILTDPAAYPAVIHCSLGKDRTGVFVALLLRALGVPARDLHDEFDGVTGYLRELGILSSVGHLRAALLR